MASETEGISLLSMYGDDDEEEEAAVATEEKESSAVSAEKREAASVATEEKEANAVAPAEDDGGEVDDENLSDNYNKSDHRPQSFDCFPCSSPLSLISPSPLRSVDGADSRSLRSPFSQRTPTPQFLASRSQLSSPYILTSPYSTPARGARPFIQEHPDVQRSRRIAVAIVDYAQDELALSPDAETAMEMENNGRVVFGVATHVSDGNVERITTVASQSFIQSSQEPLLPFVAHDQFKTEVVIEMDITGTEPEVADVKVSTNMQIDVPLQSFLPPVVNTKCSDELQEKINKFLIYKRAGKSFNADLRNRKDYRNPNFLQHAVSYQDIDEIGTCFSKEVFDPHGYDKSDYYDEIEADMKRELERKEQERKKSQKVDFVSGGSQPGGVAPAMKMNAPSPASGVSTLLSSSLPPNATIGDASRDSRTNKKSKWDKVDGDTKLPSGGHDNPPSVSVHASHLTAVNAGTGYSAFAVQVTISGFFFPLQLYLVLMSST